MYKFICQRQLRFQTHPVSAVSANLLSPMWDLKQCTVQSGCCWRPGFPFRRVAQPELQAEQIKERARVWQLESHPGFLCGMFQVLFMRVSVPKPLKGLLNTAFSILISISGFFFHGEMSFSHQRAEIRTNERIPGFLLRWEFFRLLWEHSRIPTYGSSESHLLSTPGFLDKWRGRLKGALEFSFGCFWVLCTSRAQLPLFSSRLQLLSLRAAGSSQNWHAD